MNIIAALVPIFFLIILGHILRRRALVADAFWEPAEKMTYFVFFPSLLITSTARIQLDFVSIGPMVAANVTAVLVVAGLVISTRPHIGVSGPAFTSIFQGAIRPNSYVGIAAGLMLFGEAGLGLIAALLAVIVPLVNFLSVIVLAHYVDQANGGPGMKKLVRPIITNPLIVSCFIGILLNVTGVGLPPVLGPLLDILGKAALPVGLLAVGAGLNFRALHGAMPVMSAVTITKLCLLPFVTWLAGRAFGVEGFALVAAVLYSSLPGSPSSYVLARQMGGDAELTAGIITLTTLGAMVAMPLAIVILG